MNHRICLFILLFLAYHSPISTMIQKSDKNNANLLYTFDTDDTYTQNILACHPDNPEAFLFLKYLRTYRYIFSHPCECAIRLQSSRNIAKVYLIQRRLCIFEYSFKGRNVL